MTVAHIFMLSISLSPHSLSPHYTPSVPALDAGSIHGSVKAASLLYKPRARPEDLGAIALFRNITLPKFPENIREFAGHGGFYWPWRESRVSRPDKSSPAYYAGHAFGLPPST